MGDVCGMRLFGAGLRIFGCFIYYGVSYYVSRQYLVYASEYGTASLVEAVAMIKIRSEL